MVVLTSAAATIRAKKPSGIDRTSVCRLAGVRRQRYSAFTGCLAAQNDPAAARVDVTQLQSSHLESEAAQAVISASRRVRSTSSGVQRRLFATCSTPAREDMCNRDATNVVGLTVVRAEREPLMDPHRLRVGRGRSVRPGCRRRVAELPHRQSHRVPYDHPDDTDQTAIHARSVHFRRRLRRAEQARNLRGKSVSGARSGCTQRE